MPTDSMRVRFVTVGLCALFAGCGGSPIPTVPVSGTVKFADGRPMPGGWVSFRCEHEQKNLTARGHIRQDGSFTLSTFAQDDGAVVGKHQVIVVPQVLYNERDPTESVMPPEMDPKFTRFESSGLVFEVSDDAAENQFQIQVTPPVSARSN